MVALAIIVSIVMVSVPAEEEEKENDCGCGCNSSPAEEKPLNFYDVLEKTKGWEQDVALLEEEIQEKREELLELYKKTKEGVQWKEIGELQEEIGKLEGEYWYKKEGLFEIEMIQNYTETQRDGTLKIVKESLPNIEDLDVAKALNAFEMVGEEKMMKELQLYKALFGENFKEDMQNLKEHVKIPDLDIKRIENTCREIEELEKKQWNYKKRYIEYRVSQKIKEAFTKGKSLLPNYGFGFDCDPPDPPLSGTVTFRSLKKTWVWVGMYTSPTPMVSYYTGQYCTTHYTTNVDWYWNHLPPGIDNVKSIQVKWFYVGDVIEDSWKDHNLIWEANRRYGGSVTYRYGRYTTTYPGDGIYSLSVYANHHACCYSIYKPGWGWCNTHCHKCFACDPTRAQYFSQTDTR